MARRRSNAPPPRVAANIRKPVIMVVEFSATITEDI
jgi:hypothetical protein